VRRCARWLAEAWKSTGSVLHGAVEFAILGPIEAVRDGHPVALGGPKQRAVLAMLVLAGNEAISRDRLIDGVWGERPAASARL
jgi:DNA-binding SARP family transcriptional activator